MKTIHEAQPRTPISSLPVTIAAPGSYYLTRDLVGASGQSGIDITSSWVTLDLNGFSLVGVPGSLDGIRAVVVGTRHLEIRNGVIRNWGGSGVSALLAGGVHAADLRLDGNGGSGLLVGPSSVVRDTTSTGNGVNGFLVDIGSTIIGCTARSNASIGFVLNAGSTATDCTAQQNNFGFNLGSGSKIVHSVAQTNVSGILGSEGVSIEECNASGNTDDGIRVSSRGLVRGNVVRNNTGDGIHALGDLNRIEDNQSIGNGAGIHVDGGFNLVVKNNAAVNGTEYLILGSPNKVGAISTDPTTAGPWANFVDL